MLVKYSFVLCSIAECLKCKLLQVDPDYSHLNLFGSIKFVKSFQLVELLFRDVRNFVCGSHKIDTNLVRGFDPYLYLMYSKVSFLMPKTLLLLSASGSEF